MKKLTVVGEQPPIIWVRTRTFHPEWLGKNSAENDRTFTPMCGHIYLILPNDGSVTEIRQIAKWDWIISQILYPEYQPAKESRFWYNGHNLLWLKEGCADVSSRETLRDFVCPEVMLRLESAEEAKAELYRWVFALPLRKQTLRMLLSQKGAVAKERKIHKRVGQFAQMLLMADSPISEVDGLFVVSGNSFRLGLEKSREQDITGLNSNYQPAGYAFVLPRNISGLDRGSIMHPSFTDDWLPYT